MATTSALDPARPTSPGTEDEYVSAKPDDGKSAIRANRRTAAAMSAGSRPCANARSNSSKPDSSSAPNRKPSAGSTATRASSEGSARAKVRPP